MQCFILFLLSKNYINYISNQKKIKIEQHIIFGILEENARVRRDFQRLRVD